MIIFNPYWGGLDYSQDTPPPDGSVIVFLPSVANDATAAVLQLDSEASARQFIQDCYRLSVENMYDTGLAISATV